MAKEKIKLSILIPTLEERGEKFTELYDLLLSQIGMLPVEIRWIRDNGELSIGSKRNKLLQSALGEYICFIDDDDTVSDDYIKTLMEGIKCSPDCISLRGVMTTNGNNPEIFEHSLKHTVWRETQNVIKYERNPNHLNCIKASIAKQFTFPEKNHGEDHEFSKQLHESGLIKHEYYTDKILYYYMFNPNK